MTERFHFHFSLSCIGEGNGNPLQCSCLENPRDGVAWWAAVYGVTQSRTRLKWLSSSSREGVPNYKINRKHALEAFLYNLSSVIFSSSYVWMWELDYQEGWALKNWCFWLWYWRRFLRVPRQYIKKQRHYFANKCPSSQRYGFSSSNVWMWELDHKDSWDLRTDAFELQY